MTHRESTHFSYDEFETRLLYSAREDQAPADLPARVGLALGLSIPALTIAGTLAQASSVSGSVGAGSSTTIGSSLLWVTATKGIAIGLFAGLFAIGSGQAVANIVGFGSATTHGTRPLVAPTARGHAARAQGRTASIPPSDRDNSVAANAPDVRSEPGTSEQEISEQGTDVASEFGSKDPPREPFARRTPLIAQASRVSNDGAPHAQSPQSDSTLPPTREPNPAMSSAIARFDLVPESNQAAGEPATRAKTPSEPVLSTEEYRALRAKTIAYCRTLLGRSQSTAALAQLDEFGARVGPKRVGVEEILLRIEALVDLGRRKEARREADVIERLLPNSAELRRARLLAGSRVVR